MPSRQQFSQAGRKYSECYIRCDQDRGEKKCLCHPKRTRFAKDQTACVQDSRYDGGVVVWRPVHHRRAVCAPHACDRSIVLDGDRLAFQEVALGRCCFDSSLQRMLC